MLTHYNIKAYVEGETLVLEQMLDVETATVYLAVDQLLQIADKVRGITRPDPEVGESRKLRVLYEMLRDFICDDGFADDLMSRCGDGVAYYRELLGIVDLAHEYAYGLQPDNPAPAATAQKPQGDLTAKGRADNQPAKENASDIAETMPLPNL